MEKILIRSALVLLCALLLPNDAVAKSIVVESRAPDIAYFTDPGTFGTTPICMILAPHIGITYDAKILNAATGATIPEGSTVSVGQELILKFTPYQSSQIYWFGGVECFDLTQNGDDYGIGGWGGFDSPYGNWVRNLTIPFSASDQSCYADDFVGRGEYQLFSVYNNYVPIDSAIDIYARLSFIEPLRSIVVPSGLSCNGLSQDGEMRCTVAATGTLAPVFQFSSTEGKFFNRFKDPYLINNCVTYLVDGTAAFREISTSAFSVINFGGEYTHSVPAQTISYPLIAVASGTPPTAPAISGPTVGDTCPASSYSFVLTATDPDGDRIRFGIDWSGDQVVDEWTAYVNSGATGPAVSKSWLTPGTKQFSVIASDEGGASSAWTTHSITISLCPVLGVSCWPDRSSARQGESVRWTSSVTGGTAPYAYQWSGTDGLSGFAAFVDKVYQVLGVKTATVTISDAASRVSNTNCSSLTITSGSPPPPPPPPDLCSRGLMCVGTDVYEQYEDRTQLSVESCAFGCSLGACIDIYSGGTPTLEFSARPPLVKQGNSCTLSLSATNVTSCTLTGPGVSRTYTATGGIVSRSEVVSPPIIETATYTLTCRGTSTISKKVDCRIAPTFEEF